MKIIKIDKGQCKRCLSNGKMSCLYEIDENIYCENCAKKIIGEQEFCWETGNFGGDCYECPHAYECSGYDED